MHTKRKTRIAASLLVAFLTTIFAAGPFFSTLQAHAANSQEQATTKDLTTYVDPFTGTGTQPGAPYGGGDTYPGANAPFGMVQWSPDTENYAPGGYDYTDNRIKGFSLTHLNGAGCTNDGDLPFMPYVGTVTDSPATDPTRYIATFSHSNETATAGYYQVKLDNGVTTELTANEHSGTGRFTYPTGQTATMIVNVSGSAAGADDAQANINRNTISGWVTSGHFCGANTVYRLYFWAKFSQPFATTGTWHNGTVTPGQATAQGGSSIAPAVKQVLTAQQKVHSGKAAKADRQLALQHPATSVSGPGSGAYVTFDTSKNQAITVTVGLSYVSIDNAHENVNQENASGNFDSAHQKAINKWNSKLSQITIPSGDSTQLTTFYTALYHALLQPSIFSDVNGEYTGFDGVVHKVKSGHAQYANYSGWDVYRSEFQLLALLEPKETSDIIQSMLNDYTQSGMLPKWAQADGETYVMVGDPADGMIADAYAFGARDFDTKTALAAMVKEATQTNNIRPGLNYLESLGYLPTNGSYGCCNYYGPAATTLEYNTADFSIAAFAQALGDSSTYETFITRAQDWENLFNPATDYLEPRQADGSFQANFNPSSQTGWVESNGAQYNWMVPFNLRGLFDAMGGNANVVQRLDTFFSQLNAGPDQPYAFLGNEPTLETPWLYDYAGAPYKTQAIVRKAMTTLYYPGSQGLPGNDDLGEMSSWYVFAALGFYPETPGTADVALDSPLFSSVTLKRESGQVLQINAPQAATNAPYIQSLTVNGQASTKSWLPASVVTGNSTINFTLGTTPNTSWGSSSADEPPSYREGEIPAVLTTSPSRAIVAPGGSTQASIIGQNFTDIATTVNWTISAPSGITITPSSGSFTIAANSTGQQAITVSADASVAEGYYSAAISAQTPSGPKVPKTALQIAVAKPGSLIGYYNNIGIGNDGNATGADFDGDGYSYSAQQLASNGYTPGATVTVNGTNFIWPNVPVGTYDNIEAAGQTINLTNEPTGASTLTFLGSSANGSSQTTITITYTDGSTQTAQLGFTDWTRGSSGNDPLLYGNTIAVKTTYRDAGTGSQNIASYIYASAPITLSAGKQIASISLPTATGGGQLHIFTISIQ